MRGGRLQVEDGIPGRAPRQPAEGQMQGELCPQLSSTASVQVAGDVAAVKAHPEFARIPVVIITTEGTEDDTERGMQAGAAAYVKKPFRNEELLGVINRLTASPAA